LCHGYGATGTDLVPLAREILRCEPALAGRVAFVFPEAPLQLADINPLFGDARAWWHIEVGRYASAIASGRIDSLLDEVPEGLPSARRKMRGLLDEVQRFTGLSLDRMVIGGFSQGSMLAVDVVLQLEEPPAALAILSSALIARQVWTKKAPGRRGLRVFQSHGRRDQLLPYAVAEQLRDMLVEAGLEVQFESFDDGHTIPAGVVRHLAELIASWIGRINTDTCPGFRP
jgi:phospholipase/carboxylesterase